MDKEDTRKEAAAEKARLRAEYKKIMKGREIRRRRER